MWHICIFHVQGFCKIATFGSLPRAYIMCNWAETLKTFVFDLNKTFPNNVLNFIKFALSSHLSPTKNNRISDYPITFIREILDKYGVKIIDSIKSKD